MQPPSFWLTDLHFRNQGPDSLPKESFRIPMKQSWHRGPRSCSPRVPGARTTGGRGRFLLAL